MSESEFTLKDKVVLLTGGAGLYGAGLTGYLARCGAQLILASRNKEALEKVAEDLGDNGREITCEPLDLSNPLSIDSLVESVESKHGRIDGLVNNAVLRPMQRLGDSAEAWAESMKVNSDGTFLLTRAIGEVMRKQGSGSIVNIASIQGMVGPNHYLYEGTNMTSPPDYLLNSAGM